MKKISLCLAAVTSVVIMNSCQQNAATAEPEKKAEIQLNPNDSLVTVNQGGFTFSMILPKDLMIENAPVIALNEATGDLHIQVGKNFWIVATQENTNLSAIKASLSEDMLFTNKVVEETDKSIMVQRILPDGMEYDYNYHSICELAGKSYVFRTSEEGEFSMESVNRMKHAISSVKQSV